MNLKFFAIYLVAVVFCFQPVFGYIDVIASTIGYGLKAYDYIKNHLPGDENKALQPISVTHTGGKCVQVIQKLKGKEIYVNYHVDQEPVFDIIYAAANNGHTYGKMIKTLTDKMTAMGKGNWFFQIAAVNQRVATKSYYCPETAGSKWVGKYAEYDYHVVLSENGHCSKNFRELREQSQRLKKEVDDYNNARNPC